MGSCMVKQKEQSEGVGSAVAFLVLFFQFELEPAQPLLIILKGDNEIWQFWILFMVR